MSSSRDGNRGGGGRHHGDREGGSRWNRDGGGRGRHRGGGGGGGGRYHGSRGRSPGHLYRYVARQNPVVAHPDNPSQGSGSSEIGRGNFNISPVDDVTNKLDSVFINDQTHGPNSVGIGVGNMCPDDRSPKASQAELHTPEPLIPSPLSLTIHSGVDAMTVQIFPSRDKNEEKRESLCLSSTPLGGVADSKKEPPRTVDSGFRDFHKGVTGEAESENSDFREDGVSFDICLERNRTIPKLKCSLFDKNRIARSEMRRRAQGDNVKTLRPGMILLKGYLLLEDQVKLIKTCRELGRGPGGFYQPGYNDGAVLKLRMMCLGKNWDPETKMYGDTRPFDNSKPPPITDDLLKLVQRALNESLTYLESQSKVNNAWSLVPSMTPNICIVNFYTNSGKLGLHQDKDESEESLLKGLPVVSFSIGDSAEFLYGDGRDIDKAEKVVLESGDVLIFGGKSRLIFHGVSSIIPGSAPKPLLDQTDLRPGRLNLTFREY